MREEYFNSLINGLFDIFGKNITNRQSSNLRYLKKRIDEKFIPDEAVQFIISQFEQYDNLPSNLIKAITREFMTWLEKNPQKREQVQQCPRCSRGLIGFFYVKDETGHVFACKCSCNTDKTYNHLQAWSDYQLTERGLIRVSDEPPGYEQGAENVRKWRKGEKYDKPQGYKGVFQEHEQREEHKNYMQSVEMGIDYEY